MCLTPLLEWRKSCSLSLEMTAGSKTPQPSCKGTHGKRFQDENKIAEEKKGGRGMCFLRDTSIRETRAGKGAIASSKTSKSFKTL